MGIIMSIGDKLRFIALDSRLFGMFLGISNGLKDVQDRKKVFAEKMLEW